MPLILSVDDYMTDLEKIEDKYPELRFYGIEVPNKHYHGHIDGNTVYINLLQPDWDWVLTACHEITHAEYDSGNCSNVRLVNNLRAEKWAVKESHRMYNEMEESK